MNLESAADAPSKVGARWAMVAILALAAALRFGGLGQEPLWADEFHHAGLEDSFSRVLAACREQGVQAPYFLLVHAWVLLAGSGDFALRFPSALFGTLTVVIMYWAGVALFRRRAIALVAAGLLAVSPMHVWYSQEARPYAMQVFFEVTALAALAWGMRKAEGGRRNKESYAKERQETARGRKEMRNEIPPEGGTPKLFFASAILIIAAVETHYYAVFAWAAFVLAILAAAGPFRLIRPGPALGVMAILLAGAVHPVVGILERLGPRAELQSFLPESYGPSLIVDVLRAQLLGPHGSPLPLGLQICGIALGVVVMGVGGWGLLMRNAECGMRNEESDAKIRQAGAKGRQDLFAGVILIAGWVLAAAAPTAISFVKPIVYYGQRWLIIAVPFTVLLLAAGMAGGRGRPRSRGFSTIRVTQFLICLSFLGLQLAYFPPYYLFRQKHPWDTAAGVIAREARAGEQVFVIPGRDAGLLERYLGEKRNVAGLDAAPEATLKRLREASAGRIFLVCYTNMGPWLREQGTGETGGLGRIGRTWVLETHQAGQEIWISEVMK